MPRVRSRSVVHTYRCVGCRRSYVLPIARCRCASTNFVETAMEGEGYVISVTSVPDVRSFAVIQVSDGLHLLAIAPHDEGASIGDRVTLAPVEAELYEYRRVDT